MKKLVSMVLASVLVISMAACGSPAAEAPPAEAPAAEEPAAEEPAAEEPDAEEPAAETVELTMWYWQNSVDDALIARVSEQFPGITLKAEKFPADTFLEKVTTTIASGAPLPDIITMDDWVRTFVDDSDAFVNLLDEPCNADDIKDIYAEWKWNAAMSSDGTKLIAIPMDTGPSCLYYRADLFEAAGLPTDPAEVAEAMPTWDKAYEVAAQLQAALPDVKMFDYLNNIYTSLTTQGTGHFFNEQGEFTGDSDEMKNAFLTAARGRDFVLGGNSMFVPEWGASLNEGKVAAFVGAVWMKTNLKQAAPDSAGNWHVTTIPGGPSNRGGSCIGISANCQNVEAAWNVISWMQNEENQTNSMLTMDLFPSVVAAMEDPQLLVEEEYFGNQVVNQYFMEAAKGVKDVYLAPNYTPYLNIYRNQMLLIQDQNKDPEQAWNDAVQEAKDLLAIS